jgi:diacylglycerol kinase
MAQKWGVREGCMSFFPEVPVSAQRSHADVKGRPKRAWRAKFGDALRGLKIGIRGHSSFFVHFFFSALVLAAAVILRCEVEQWCLLLLCIGLVLIAELFNSAIETLFRGLDEVTKEKTWRCLDVSAGAVLMASAFAIVIGAVVFCERLLTLLASAAAGP